MPISRIKRDAINDGAINIAKTDNLFVNTEISGTEAARMPQGTTAQRASAQTGDIRFNSDLNLMEYYDGTIWKAIDSPPVVSSISPASIADTDSSVDIVITGSNFQSGATVKAVGTDGSEINATTVTVTSSTQVTANFNGTSFSDANEDYDIVLANPSGLSGTLVDSLAVNASPVWTTAASPTTLATVNDGDTISGSTIQVVATDDEGASLTYSLSSGSLPAGLSVQTDGTITGTVTAGAGTYASGGETYTPTLSVTDGSNTINRTFSIVKKWYDGSTSALAAASIASLYDIGISNGMVWIQNANINSGNPFQMRYASYDNRGWLEVLWSIDTARSTPTDHWLNTAGTNYTRPQIYDYNLSSGGLNYVSGDSSFRKMHSSMNIVDVAFTTKSSITANGVAATGQNQSSVYPLVASNDLRGQTAQDITNTRTALANYFGNGNGEGFHAAYSTGTTSDYNAGWYKNSLGFEIILGYRSGSQSLDEWHIADGNAADGSTHAPNYGYRDAPAQPYDGPGTAGSWSDSTSTKSGYQVSSSNVMSIWVSDEL